MVSKRVVCDGVYVVPVTFKGELSVDSRRLTFFCRATPLDQCSDLLKLNYCREVNLQIFISP